MDAQAPPALPPDSPARETRRALRERLIALRRAQPEAQIAAWSARIQEHLATAFPQLAGLRVGFCWPIQNEPDLRPLLAQWRATGQPGFAALLPVVVAPATPLAFRAWDDAVLATRLGGIEAAKGNATSARDFGHYAFGKLQQPGAGQDIDTNDWLKLADEVVTLAPDLHTAYSEHTLASLPPSASPAARRDTLAQLARVQAMLEAGDSDGLYRYFEEAKQTRDDWLDK